MGRAGFEPTKKKSPDLQSGAFDHSAIFPKKLLFRFIVMITYVVNVLIGIHHEALYQFFEYVVSLI